MDFNLSIDINVAWIILAATLSVVIWKLRQKLVDVLNECLGLVRDLVGLGGQLIGVLNVLGGQLKAAADNEVMQSHPGGPSSGGTFGSTTRRGNRKA